MGMKNAQKNKKQKTSKGKEIGNVPKVSKPNLGGFGGTLPLLDGEPFLLVTAKSSRSKFNEIQAQLSREISERSETVVKSRRDAQTRLDTGRTVLLLDDTEKQDLIDESDLRRMQRNYAEGRVSREDVAKLGLWEILPEEFW